MVSCGDFVLGCARLAITDRRSTQPVVLRGGRYTAVLNGAITNARALWQDLRPRMLRRDRLPNDAWLPLLLVARGEPERLASLMGHHALAVVDAHTNRLWLSRDAMGEKPLFVVREQGAVVAFASTLPALRELGIVASLPEASVARFFCYGNTGSVAHTTAGRSIDGDGTNVSQQAIAAGRTVPSMGASVPFASALSAATARCVDAEPAVALSLSGGVDSSCLAAVLKQQGRAVAAYQFAASGSNGDERSIAREVAAHCGHHLRLVDGGPEVLAALPELTRHWGLPLGDPSVLAVHAVARAAAADGVRILLSGEGADEALLGYQRHRALRFAICLGGPMGRLWQWSSSYRARLWRAMWASRPYDVLLEVTPPGFRRAVLARGDEPLPLGLQWSRTSFERRLALAGAIDRDVYLRHDLLPKLDVATMAAQIEGRCPFLDGEVQSSAAALPWQQRYRKQPLRAAYAASLPRSVFAQRKRGFSLPLDRWFRTDLPFLDLLREPRTRQRQHLHARGLDAAIDRHRSGKADLGHGLYLLVA
ncbi:MAG: asparagine synthase-related protein, partial [Planctomycetota bacterium]